MYTSFKENVIKRYKPTVRLLTACLALASVGYFIANGFESRLGAQLLAGLFFVSLATLIMHAIRHE